MTQQQEWIETKNTSDEVILDWRNFSRFDDYDKEIIERILSLHSQDLKRKIEEMAHDDYIDTTHGPRKIGRSVDLEKVLDLIEGKDV